MTTLPLPLTFDTTRDLEIERLVPAPAAALWRGWTQPDLLMEWFCPRPWKVTAATLDLRPGGAFRTLMQGPDGESVDNLGCVLEVVPERRLVFTSLLLPDFRPAPRSEGPQFTGVLLLEPQPDGRSTRYIARAMHPDAATRDAHEAMGFHQGWNAALDQLIELVR